MSLSRGGRNLLLLGLGSTLIALATTSVSLAVYHYSGDIYLDRSRPGFLPDQEEEEEEQKHDTKYTFSDSGAIDDTAIDEYLQEIQPATGIIEQLSDPFPSDSLSDNSLGIPDSAPESSAPESSASAPAEPTF